MTKIMTLDAIEARYGAARREVYRLCHGGDWMMSVPVRGDDSDIVLMASLRDVPALQVERDAAVDEVAQLRGELERAAAEGGAGDGTAILDAHSGLVLKAAMDRLEQERYVGVGGAVVRKADIGYLRAALSLLGGLRGEPGQAHLPPVPEAKAGIVANQMAARAERWEMMWGMWGTMRAERNAAWDEVVRLRAEAGRAYDQCPAPEHLLRPAPPRVEQPAQDVEMTTQEESEWSQRVHRLYVEVLQAQDIARSEERVFYEYMQDKYGALLHGDTVVVPLTASAREWLSWQSPLDEDDPAPAQGNGDRRGRTAHLKLGESCGHPGCLSHLSHPCEGCGRIGGQRITYSPGPPPVDTE